MIMIPKKKKKGKKFCKWCDKLTSHSTWRSKHCIGHNDYLKWIEKKSEGKRSVTKKSDTEAYEALVRSEKCHEKGPPVAAAAVEAMGFDNGLGCKRCAFAILGCAQCKARLDQRVQKRVSLYLGCSKCRWARKGCTACRGIEEQRKARGGWSPEGAQTKWGLCM